MLASKSLGWTWRAPSAEAPDRVAFRLQPRRVRHPSRLGLGCLGGWRADFCRWAFGQSVDRLAVRTGRSGVIPERWPSREPTRSSGWQACPMTRRLRVRLGESVRAFGGGAIPKDRIVELSEEDAAAFLRDRRTRNSVEVLGWVD